MQNKPTLNPNLKDFWKTPARVKVLYGGRSSSKTWDAAGMAVFLAQRYHVKFLCTRQFQNRITDSVYTVIKHQIERFGLSKQFKITNNSIININTGSEFIFYGLWRNIDEIKSLEGVDVCWIEEAHNLSKEQWEILEPTIRKDGSEFWIIFNPQIRTDFVYKNFILNTPDYAITRKINYDENPFLSETMMQLIESKKLENEDDYRHIYLGEPRNDNVNSLFDYKTIDRAMNRNADTSGSTILGVDVARFGDDSTVIVTRQGLQVTDIEMRQQLSTTETASWVANKTNSIQSDGTIIDTIGVGAGVYDQLTQQGFYCIEGNFGYAADDKNRFINKRAECYFRLSEALKKGLALPQDDALVEELVSVTYEYNEAGKIKITSKDKIKENLGRSPDKADALALTFFTTVHKQYTTSQAYDDVVIPNLY